MSYSLKELRTLRNETQQETANALGISVQTYNIWEKDITKVAVSKALSVAEHFGVTLEDITLKE